MSKTAFDARRMNAFLMDPNDLVIIGLDTDDGPEHPLYDKRIFGELSPGAIKNVKYHGVIEPVIVQKVGLQAIVVDGRRRTRLAREANKQLVEEGKEPIFVPAILRRGDDADLVGVMISANEVREDDEPLAKAEKIQRYMNMGRSEEQAADMAGVTVATIRNWLKLLDAAPEVKEAVRDGKIAATAAVRLAELDVDEQVETLDEVLSSGEKPTVKNVRETVTKVVTPGKRKIRKVADKLGNNDAAKVLGWVLGELDDSEICQLIPKFKEALNASG